MFFEKLEAFACFLEHVFDPAGRFRPKAASAERVANRLARRP